MMMRHDERVRRNECLKWGRRQTHFLSFQRIFIERDSRYSWWLLYREGPETGKWKNQRSSIPKQL